MGSREITAAENRAPGPSKEMEPPDEIGGDTIVRAKAATAACPDPEDIAAFLDGRLPAGQRARLIEHLASCELCYEVYAGAASFLADDSPEAIRLSEPLTPHRPFDRPDRRRAPEAPSWRRWWATAAVAALLAVAVGVPLLLWRTGGAELATEHLASLVAGRPGAKADVWVGRVMRGSSESAEVAPDVQSFRLGVRFLDLRLALAADDRDAAEAVLSRFAKLFDGIPFPGDVPDRYRTLRNQLGDEKVPPHSLLAAAGALESKGFKDLVEPRYVDLGRWTEACRLAGKAGRPALFRERAARPLLDQAVAPDAKEPSDLPQRALDTLRTLRDALAGGHADADALGRSCQELLEQLDFD